MKIIKISLLLIAILYTGIRDAESQSKYIVEIGTIDSLYSNALKDSREYYVQLSENEEINIDNVMQDNSEFTLFARSNIKLAELAKTNPQNGLNIQWKYYSDDLHMTVVLPTIRDGLIYLFEWFQMENTAKINNPDTPVNELEKVVRHRANKLEAHFGYKHPPYDEELLNMLGYMNLDMGFPERSLAFFLMGIEYFPLSDRNGFTYS